MDWTAWVLIVLAVVVAGGLVFKDYATRSRRG